MGTFLGVGWTNWLLWILMVTFIVIYFVVTEIINRKEDRIGGEGEDN